VWVYLLLSAATAAAATAAAAAAAAVPGGYESVSPCVERLSRDAGMCSWARINEAQQ
jgi:hypothetical protein